MVWYLYRYRDDKCVIEGHYDGVKKYLDYLSTRATDNIVGYGLSDWVAPKTKTPGQVTGTGYYYTDARLVAQMAQLLGKDEDARKYFALADDIKRAFNTRFVNAQPGQVANGSLTAQSCVLFQGLIEECDRPTVVRALVEEVQRQDYHMDVGILDAKYLLRVLADNGRADVVWRILQQRSKPSCGATTLWKEWNGNQSRNHIMFGDVSAWFTKYLAGIQMVSPGFKGIVLRPHLLGLKSAGAAHDSVNGRIESGWAISQGVLRWKVTVPANTSATVFVPCAPQDQVAITEGGQPIARAKGVRLVHQEEEAAVFEVGAGTYLFACPKR